LSGRSDSIPSRSSFYHTLREKAKAMKAKVASFSATPLQVKWIEAILSGKYKFLGIGGGIRGTKTFACLSAIIILCRIYPRSRWAVVRKDLPTLRRNVVPSMNKLLIMSGGFVGELNQSVWTYTCANGSEIILFPEQFIQDPELERWKGLEVNGFDLEECSELSEKAANKAIERAGSYTIAPIPGDPRPKQPPPIVMCNMNPCSNWPRRWFYEPWKNGTIKEPYFFLPATIADNPYASEEYKESLKYLPPEEYNRFVKGEWDFVDDPDQLIKTEWVWNALNVEPVDGPSKLSADIARFGDDFTTIAKGKGNQLRKMISIKNFDLIRVGTAVLNEAADPSLPVKGPACKLDGVGLGAGTVDYCHKQGLPVRNFIAGAKAVYRPPEHPSHFFKFKDLRSQAWWEFREKLRRGEICLQMVDTKGEPVPLPEKLVGDLAAPRYEITGDKMVKVEEKKDTKERLGRSPDDGDAVVMLFFDMPDLPTNVVLPGSVVISRGS
jgi:hypothetical protein